VGSVDLIDSSLVAHFLVWAFFSFSGLCASVNIPVTYVARDEVIGDAEEKSSGQILSNPENYLCSFGSRARQVARYIEQLPLRGEDEVMLSSSDNWERKSYREQLQVGKTNDDSYGPVAHHAKYGP